LGHFDKGPETVEVGRVAGVEREVGGERGRGDDQVESVATSRLARITSPLSFRSCRWVILRLILDA
jgi:hypothetical protein